MPIPRTVDWITEDESGGLGRGHMRLIAQTRLPSELVFLDITAIEDTWQAIKRLDVRGAPAIGIAAAMGLVASLQDIAADSTGELLDALDKRAAYLATSRPTAVNLFWALDRMRAVATAHAALAPKPFIDRLIREAVTIRNEDAAMCRAIGTHGASLLRDGSTVLTHCNAGSLAASELGTALAPVYVATEQGRRIHVYSDETRPLLQGSRLTAWELREAGVAVTVICDNTAAQVMKEGRIDVVFVGADRIAANGDAANKIGTYGVALLARAHNIPFYVLAPSSTIDLATPNGEGIPIEVREPSEVTRGFGQHTAPENVVVYSPAFDVTPAALIAGIITEKGILKPTQIGASPGTW